MADLPRVAVWRPGIYQLEKQDLVLAGPDGISNRQATELGDCTLYLKEHLDAVELATRAAAVDYTFSGTVTSGTGKFALTELNSVGTWALTGGNEVTPPYPGLYLVSFVGLFTSTLADNPLNLRIRLNHPDGATEFAGMRYSAVATDPVFVSATTLVRVEQSDIDSGGKFSLGVGVSSLDVATDAGGARRFTITRVTG